jgi:hypothetical protein
MEQKATPTLAAMASSQFSGGPFGSAPMLVQQEEATQRALSLGQHSTQAYSLGLNPALSLSQLSHMQQAEARSEATPELVGGRHLSPGPAVVGDQPTSVGHKPGQLFHIFRPRTERKARLGVLGVGGGAAVARRS